VEVRLRVPTPLAILKPDMTISIDLAVGSAKQAVTVPSVAIRGASDPTPYVYVVDQGHIGRRELKLGLRGDSVVEVLSGLEEGAAVVLPGGKVSVGERVRTEKN
jgi:multidrug efflux pump subunit AcrA (membrane-fusion protein)